jgi:hypothetical protein
METIKQPNLEGEKMKLPTQRPGSGGSEEAPRFSGAIIGGLIAALCIISAGLFYWFQIMQQTIAPAATPTRPTADMNNEPESTTAEAQAQSFSVMSTSDELTAIEADLESTDLTSLELELTQIDTELESSISGG